MSLLYNPNRPIPEDLLKGWADRVGREVDYGKVTQTREEGVLVSKTGLLQIEWPARAADGIAADEDIILATTNDPEIVASSPCYPTASMIADAWNRAGANVAYFWNNIDNGICTFQDDDIQEHLIPREGREHGV